MFVLGIAGKQSSTLVAEIRADNNAIEGVRVRVIG